MSLTEEALSYAIIGKAMEVHRELGPGVDEVFYHKLLADRLRAAGIDHRYKPREALVHRGRTADIFEPDLVFPDRLIAELKWLWGGFAPEHFLQLKSYLKLWRISDGLFMDFGKESLVQKRFVFHDLPAPPVDTREAMKAAPRIVVRERCAREICEAFARVVAQYGLGYRDTTYRGIMAAEFSAEGLDCRLAPTVTVRSSTSELGTTQLPCLVVAQAGAVMVLSQREGIRAADRAILQSWLKHLGLPWGIILHFGKTAPQLRWVTAPKCGRKDSGRNMD